MRSRPDQASGGGGMAAPAPPQWAPGPEPSSGIVTAFQPDPPILPRSTWNTWPVASRNRLRRGGRGIRAVLRKSEVAPDDPVVHCERAYRILVSFPPSRRRGV